jgi:hypothetical protein
MRNDRWVVVFVAAATVASGYFAYRVGAAPRGAKQIMPAQRSGFVGFSPAWVDLGDQLWNTSVPFELTFVNESGRPVELASVRTSCGCTLVDTPGEEQRNVAPGKSLTLLGMLNVDTNLGRRTQSVDVRLLGGETYTVRIAASVYGTHKLGPDPVEFGPVPAIRSEGEGPERQLVFESKTDQVVAEPVVDVRWLECRVVERSEDRTVVSVRVRGEALCPGFNDGTVCLPTSSSVKPNACVRVRVVGTPGLVTVPQHVFLNGEAPERVRFLDGAGQAVRVASIEPVDPRLTVMVDGGGELEVRKVGDASLGGILRLTVRDSIGREGVVLVSMRETR